MTTNKDNDIVTRRKAAIQIESLLWEAQLRFISHDYISAISSLKFAVSLGSSRACASLGNLYGRGMKEDGEDVVHSDIQEAIKFFQIGLDLIRRGISEDIDDEEDDDELDKEYKDTIQDEKQEGNKEKDWDNEIQETLLNSPKFVFRKVQNSIDTREEIPDRNVYVLHDIMCGLSSFLIYDKIQISDSIYNDIVNLIRLYVDYEHPFDKKNSHSIRIHANYALGLAMIYMLRRNEGSSESNIISARTYFSACIEMGVCGIRETDVLVERSKIQLAKLLDNGIDSDFDRSFSPETILGASHVNVVGVGLRRATMQTDKEFNDLSGCHFCLKKGTDLPLCSCRLIRYCSYSCKLQDIGSGGHVCVKSIEKGVQVHIA